MMMISFLETNETVLNRESSERVKHKLLISFFGKVYKVKREKFLRFQSVRIPPNCNGSRHNGGS